MVPPVIHTASLVDENTKPSVRVGRKAYRVLQRQPGCRNIAHISAPAFCLTSRSGALQEVNSKQAVPAMEEFLRTLSRYGAFRLLLSHAERIKQRRQHILNTVQTLVMLGGGFYLTINISFILWYNLLATRSKEPARIHQREHSLQHLVMVPQSRR